MATPIFKSAFLSPDDEFTDQGVRPVVFDILGPDHETSMLPDGLRMVLHVNPKTMSITHAKLIERIQTKGGFVEQHWGDAPPAISFDMATGGFKRQFVGMSAQTTPGGRRDTIAHDKYLDLRALFHNNGSIRDSAGNVILKGIIKISFDGGVYLGWFSSFEVNETADSPFQFQLSAAFVVEHEVVRLRSTAWSTGPGGPTRRSPEPVSATPAILQAPRLPPGRAIDPGLIAREERGNARRRNER